jgi:hypothetical protein
MTLFKIDNKLELGVEERATGATFGASKKQVIKGKETKKGDRASLSQLNATPGVIIRVNNN